MMPHGNREFPEVVVVWALQESLDRSGSIPSFSPSAAADTSLCKPSSANESEKVGEPGPGALPGQPRRGAPARSVILGLPRAGESRARPPSPSVLRGARAPAPD